MAIFSLECGQGKIHLRKLEGKIASCVPHQLQLFNDMLITDCSIEFPILQEDSFDVKHKRNTKPPESSLFPHAEGLSLVDINLPSYPVGAFKQC